MASWGRWRLFEKKKKNVEARSREVKTKEEQLRHLDLKVKFQIFNVFWWFKGLEFLACDFVYV